MTGATPCNPATIGPYVVHARLDRPNATGGAVWRVAAPETPTVADRVLKQIDRRIEFGRGRAEIAALRMLRLDGIPRLLDAGSVDGQPWLVTEYVDGAPFPGRAGPLPWGAVAPLAQALLAVLAAVHREGFVHCDLKPSNILVGADGQVSLLDFGLATWRSPGEAGPGTSGFAAPEQSRGGRHAGAPTDLFAVGRLLGYALLGHLRGRKHTARSLRARPDVPAAVVDAIDALQQVRPEARPRCADAAWRLLRGVAVRPEVPALDALTDADDAAALRGLFAGHEPLFHAPSAAAQRLFARTDGQAERVREEVAVWLRSGVALPTKGRLLVDRAGLHRIEHGLPRPVDWTVDPDSPAAQVLGAVDLAWPWTDRATLAAVVGGPVAAALAGLIASGAVRALPDGRHQARRGAPLTDANRRAALHGALADHLPADAPLRVYHLVRAGRVDAAIELAMGRARAALDAGHPPVALAWIEEIALAARRLDAARWRAVCTLWTGAAFYEQSARTLHGVLIGMGDRPVPAIAALIEARLSASAPLPGPFADPTLEFWRRSVQRRRGEPVAARPDDAPLLVGQALLYRASAAYARFAWRTAAALRLEAATWLAGPIQAAARIDAASALLEALALDDAAAIVAALTPEVQAAGLGYLEGRAAWLARAIAHRRGACPAPDRAWEEAIIAFDQPALSGVALLTEAAIAWQAERQSDCVRLAGHAREAWLQLGAQEASLLCRALAAAAAGEPLRPAPSLAAIESIAAPGVAMQILALLVAAGHPPGPIRAIFEASVPSEAPTLRRAILSPDEARALVG